jgi:hypothetical protein
MVEVPVGYYDKIEISRLASRVFQFSYEVAAFFWEACVDQYVA